MLVVGEDLISSHRFGCNSRKGEEKGKGKGKDKLNPIRIRLFACKAFKLTNSETHTNTPYSTYQLSTLIMSKRGADRQLTKDDEEHEEMDQQSVSVGGGDRISPNGNRYRGTDKTRSLATIGTNTHVPTPTPSLLSLICLLFC